jgi:PilZ domain
MDAQTVSRQNKQAMTMEASRRRSMRVLLSVPIRVTGKTASNEDFEEQTRTLVVNAHGALISLQASVATNQHLTVEHKATNESRECRVVHVGTQAAGKIQVGIEFVKPSGSFWQIDFPPDDWVVPES